MEILVIIPARGGSKTIPRKNLRLINGKPLIYYSIHNALELKKYFSTRVVVSTDDCEIAEVASKCGAEVIMRPTELAGDSVTLDPVIYNIYQNIDGREAFDVVITMQPTSPTLKVETLVDAIEYFEENEYDTVISCVNDPHLSWRKTENGIEKNYLKRVNRQMLPAHYKETGGFLISKANCIQRESRIGEKTAVFEVDLKEAIDIDTYDDWIVCESILKSKKIILRADGEEALGMGHIYRTLSLAYHLVGHELLFVTNENKKMGVEKLHSSFFKMRTIKNDDQLFEIIDEFQPDIVINDILNTEKEYVERMKKKVPRVINFEDKGEGAKYADVVINALYSNAEYVNEYVGFEYFFLRDEFMTVRPKDFSEDVENIVVLFGGTDPSDLTRKIYKIFQQICDKYPKIEFHIITGFGYKYKRELLSDPEHKIYVHNDVKRVSEYLSKADIAITAQGRTIYEIASMGIPSIVLAQNSREMEHDFAAFSNGFINLGLGKEIADEAIVDALCFLIQAKGIRKQMREILLKKDFTKGQDRVIKLILGE